MTYAKKDDMTFREVEIFTHAFAVKSSDVCGDWFGSLQQWLAKHCVKRWMIFSCCASGFASNDRKSVSSINFKVCSPPKFDNILGMDAFPPSECSDDYSFIIVFETDDDAALFRKEYLNTTDFGDDT